jgi:hypothetical protein
MTSNLARLDRPPVMVFWRDKEHDGVVVDWLRTQAGLLPIELVRPNGPSRADDSCRQGPWQKSVGDDRSMTSWTVPGFDG